MQQRTPECRWPHAGAICRSQREILTAQTSENLPCLGCKVAAALGDDLLQQLARLIRVAHFLISLGQGQLGADVLATRLVGTPGALAVISQ